MKEINYFSFVVENVEFTVYTDETEFVLNRHLFSPVHMHPINEMCIMIKGNSLIKGDFPTVSFNQYDVCIIPPLTYHNTFTHTDSTLDRITVKFTFRKLDNVNSTANLYEILKPLLATGSAPIKLGFDKMMIENLINMDSSGDNTFAMLMSDPIQSIKTKNIFSLFFICIAEQLCKTSLPPDTKLKIYNKDLRYYARLVSIDVSVYTYTSGKISFAELADRFHVCEKQLSHTIKTEYGTTAKMLTYETRMKRAASLLIHFPDTPIHVIAENVGYSSPEILSIMFKKYYGMSATEYKKRNISTTTFYSLPENY
ncbi:MAG: AraC family transcriptional regulator [Clostridia bacterium]|nr:AraC family transcriptional regulator [Clostridia bacterium]